MYARARGVAVVGVRGQVVAVEAHVGRGLPALQLTGLPGRGVQDARERVRPAVESSGLEWPLRRVTVNLSPADVRKDGPGFDLPIALAVLAATAQVQREQLERYVVSGELSLRGALLPTPGVLAVAWAARQAGHDGVIVPEANVAEAALVEGLEVVGAPSLARVAEFLRGEWRPEALAEGSPDPRPAHEADFAEVRGQGEARRALEIAAAGGHNVLMMGPPGAGKTMLARRLATILPAMSRDEALEATRLHSVAGLLGAGRGLVTARPFRSPHHSVSAAGLLGGGSGAIRPGEVSLAHENVTMVPDPEQREGPTMKAVTYARLSASRQGDDAPGLDRQRQATERLVRERGWNLVAHHHDADTSAWSGRERPALAAVRDAIAAGEADVLVTWKVDRAFRSIPEAAAFLGFLREHDAAFVSVTEGIDTTTTFGPVLFNLFAALAEIESNTRSERLAAWHSQRAEEGRPGGGGFRPFGFREDRVTHEPSEAREVRRMAKRLLGGWTLSAVVRDLNERGVPTTTGGRWSKVGLSRMIVSPRVAGLRQHNGATHPATWKPILSEEQHVALQQLFADRRRGEVPGRRYLLTGGLARCGLCGAPLIARPKADGRRCYVCPPRAESGCGKIRALAAPLEELVADEAALAWDRRPPEEPPEERPEEELRRQVAADTDALEELARDRYVRRTIGDAEYQAARSDLVTRIEEARVAVERLGRGRRAFLHDLEDFPAPPWEAAPGTDPEGLEEWRAFVAEVVERVDVGPAVRGRNRFDPERVEIAFRA